MTRNDVAFQKIVDSHTPKMVPIEAITGNKTENTFRGMASEASSYLLSHEWCKEIVRGYWALGWEGVLAVFFFRFVPAKKGVDSTVWVIVGDIPPAYICNDNRDAATALEGYTTEMQKWVEAVKKRKSVKELIPVNAKPTREYADMLESRLKFIREELLPIACEAPESIDTPKE
ncbi:MAG TPA: hypothetical protein VNT79_04250 [Phycisphaerae bacterium]|nr:hypothetical protein [Phycisphaerae bacterium]